MNKALYERGEGYIKTLDAQARKGSHEKELQAVQGCYWFKQGHEKILAGGLTSAARGSILVYS